MTKFKIQKTKGINMYFLKEGREKKKKKKSISNKLPFHC